MGCDYSIVGQKDLLEMLENGEIFKPETWTKDNLGAAAYDLRVADDFLVVPDENDPKGYKRHPKGDKRKSLIVLKPGDVAFISSQEKIRMPWNLAAHISIKFTLASKGLLLLTGVFVAPGYGMEEWSGSPIPKEDERIHFIIANLGSETLKLKPGEDRIGSLQFFRVAEPSDELKPKLYVEGGKAMEQEFFLDESRQQGLVFVNQIKQTMDKIKSLEDDLRNTNVRLDAISSGTNQIVLFGVYLLCASVLAAALAFTLSVLGSKGAYVARWCDRWPYILCILAFLLLAGCIIYSAIRLTGRTSKMKDDNGSIHRDY
jgi:deoxycytidine triphosphate deaminase